MDDRRQHNRLQPSFLLEVFAQPDGTCLGRIADLSAEGFMLCSKAPQAANTLVECRLVCSSAPTASEAIHFTADCLRSRNGEQGQQSWGGYQIIDIDELQNLALRRLLQQLSEQS